MILYIRSSHSIAIILDQAHLSYCMLYIMTDVLIDRIIKYYTGLKKLPPDLILAIGLQ